MVEDNIFEICPQNQKNLKTIQESKSFDNEWVQKIKEIGALI